MLHTVLRAVTSRNHSLANLLTGGIAAGFAVDHEFIPAAVAIVLGVLITSVGEHFVRNAEIAAMKAEVAAHETRNIARVLAERAALRANAGVE